MRRILGVVAVVCLAWIVVSCGDTSRSTSPSGLAVPNGARRAITPGTCTTLSSLTSQLTVVFGSGANFNAALARLNSVDSKITNGNFVGAQTEARNLITFVQQKAQANQLVGTRTQIQSLIDNLLCYAGIDNSTVLVLPTDQPQVITDPTGQAGVQLDAQTVDVPTLVTVQILDPNVSPLITKLDKYPGFIEMSSSSPLTKPAIVGVCPTGPIPPDVLARLRLGHQATTGFEITAPADAGFLNCPAVVGASKTPAWLKRLASIVMPKTLYAATMMGGGVGGVATEFSPFGPVDPELSFVGGVGGTSTEFMRAHDGPTTLPGATMLRGNLGTFGGTLNSATCPAVQALPGAAVPPECRPVVTITTHNGTIMQNVPVSWSVTGGGGAITPNDPATDVCSLTYGSTTSTTSNILGKVSVCWTLGSSAGNNTVVAQPHIGGDVPEGVNFAPPGVLFTALAAKLTPTASATGGTFPYDALPHAGSGTCSNALTPALSYSGGSTPVNSGSYTLTVSCGGDAQYNLVTATATITVTKLSATAAAGSAIIILGTTVPTMPCTVTGLLPSETGVVTCTSSAATVLIGSNVVMPIVSPANPPNYTMQLVNGTLSILYRQDGCFLAPLSPTPPPTSAYIVRTTPILVRCTMKTASNVSMPVAGSILVQDRGTTGTAAPITVLSKPNAFTFTSGSNVYNLSMLPLGYFGGHYYQVTATWSDGSTTTGWFYIRQ